MQRGSWRGPGGDSGLKACGRGGATAASLCLSPLGTSTHTHAWTGAHTHVHTQSQVSFASHKTSSSCPPLSFGLPWNVWFAEEIKSTHAQHIHPPRSGLCQKHFPQREGEVRPFPQGNAFFRRTFLAHCRGRRAHTSQPHPRPEAPAQSLISLAGWGGATAVASRAGGSLGQPLCCWGGASLGKGQEQAEQVGT